MSSILPIIINPKGIHRASIIVLHGFGAGATDWLELANLQSLKPYVRWIFPQAPLRPISLYGGEKIPAWHDILASHANRLTPKDEDEPGMNETLSMIESLIEGEVASGLDRKSIIVSGFSQGGGMTLLQGVVGKGIGGIAILSGYAPLKFKIVSMKGKDTDTLPVFWAHGTADEVIKYSVATDAYKMMKESGMKNIEFHSYKGMGHSYCPEELFDLEAWIGKTLPNVGSEGSSKICEPVENSWNA